MFCSSTSLCHCCVMSHRWQIWDRSEMGKGYTGLPHPKHVCFPDKVLNQWAVKIFSLEYQIKKKSFQKGSNPNWPYFECMATTGVNEPLKHPIYDSVRQLCSFYEKHCQVAALSNPSLLYLCIFSWKWNISDYPFWNISACRRDPGLRLVLLLWNDLRIVS